LYPPAYRRNAGLDRPPRAAASPTESLAPGHAAAKVEGDMNRLRLFVTRITPDRLRKRVLRVLRTAHENTVGLAMNSVYGWRHRNDATQYGIIAGYRHRSQATYFDDTCNTDEFQKEVYQYATDLMRSEGMQVVHDIGCGSGYKLVHYLGEYRTVGYDVQPTVSFLKSKYPAREWRVTGSAIPQDELVDLVICADVIEHVVNPETLTSFINQLNPRYIIISTPDRDLSYAKGSYYYYGPPSNPTHIREWSRHEFRQYISQTFDVIEHRITNPAQDTQMLLCKPKNSQPIR
jgi:hypothetical protein